MKNNISIGCDIENIDRFNKILRNKEVLLNIFTEGEIKHCFRKKKPEVCLARKFAAKEAIFKALSLLGNDIAFKSIEIVRQGKKQDIVRVSYKDIDKKYNIHLDVSNIKNIVIASSIAERISTQ